MPGPPFENRFLAVLSRSSQEDLLRGAAEVNLPLGANLFERNERPRSILLLQSGIGSIVFSSERGNSVELSTEGKEGIIGWLSLLGPTPQNTGCSMQVGGRGFRIPRTHFQEIFDRNEEVRARILEYAQHQFGVANQVLACNRLHRAEARFSRWILMVADRIQSDDLPMTQEFMSIMLGTRRTTVAEVASGLARAGAVEGRRGGLRIVDRKKLERHACECYHLLHAQFQTLFSKPLPGHEAGNTRHPKV